MIIRRKHNANYTVVPNGPINDEALTFEALGLLTYLLSRPDNWQVNISQLRLRGELGKDKAQSLMRLLIATGYVVRRQYRAENSNQFKAWEYIVYDCPQAQKDELEPEPENQAPIINTDLTKSPYGEACASRQISISKNGDTMSPLTPKPKTISSLIWAEALSLLSHEPLSEPQKRTLIGKWQKRTPTELAKKELLAAVRAAAKAGTPEPISYVEASLRKYPVPPDPVTFTPTDWQRNVQAAIKTKQWAQNWGPPPGKRGCRVPPDLVTPQLQSALSQGTRA